MNYTVDSIDPSFSRQTKKPEAKISEADIIKIASEILDENKLIFCDELDKFFIYRDGVFREINNTNIKNIIKTKLGERFNTYRGNEIKANLQIDSCLTNLNELNATDLLNLKNGMLDTNTFELKPHSPDYLSTIQLPVNYNPDAQCPLWIKTLDEIF